MNRYDFKKHLHSSNVTKLRRLGVDAGKSYRSSRLAPVLASRRAWYVVLAVIAVVLLVINSLIFYPGFMSLDSLRQLSQALGNEAYWDWHPPVMAWIWSICIALTGKISSMLVLQLTLLWGSLLILAAYTYKQSGKRLLSLLPLAIGLSPGIVGLSGVIWKDVQLAYVLLLGLTLSLCIVRIPQKFKPLTLGVIALCLIYALLLRYNAVLAVLPIAYFAISQVTRSHKMQIAALLGIIVIGLGIGGIINQALSVRASNPTASVMLDDIVNVVPRIKDKQFGQDTPAELSRTLQSIQDTCRQNDIILNTYGYCTDAADKQLVTQKYYPEIRTIWVSAILENPGRYIAFKLNAIAIFLTSPARYTYIVHPGIDSNQLNLAVRNPGNADLLFAYVNTAHRELGITFRPYFWLSLSIGLFIYARRLVRYTLAVRCLTISSVLYILGYSPIVVAADYRYIYWSVLATLVAILLVILDKYPARSKQKLSRRS